MLIKININISRFKRFLPHKCLNLIQNRARKPNFKWPLFQSQISLTVELRNCSFESTSVHVHSNFLQQQFRGHKVLSINSNKTFPWEHMWAYVAAILVFLKVGCTTSEDLQLSGKVL